MTSIQLSQFADLAKQWEKIYPVGSIYISVNSTNPASLFGGTWEQIKDRFLLAAGDAYAAGSTGGEAMHTLTVDEMPSHCHHSEARAFLIDSGKKEGWGAAIRNIAGDYAAIPVTPNVMLTGGSQPHNNMPPYLAVYMWQRTA